MRLPGSMTLLLSIGLLIVGCGWSPPSAPVPQADTCTPADGPSPDTVAREIAATPGGAAWVQTGTGYTPDCRLHWVQLTPVNPAPNSPQQVLFFDRQTPLGPATPEPRPYISVLAAGDSAVQVQYQWQQGADEPCCPTGIGTVHFRIGDDGRLEALDPIPGP